MRSLLGLLSILNPPGDHSGLLFDFCYSIVESPKSAIAHKAYAITILYNISVKEPELKPELITLFEEQRETESAGIRSKIHNLLKKLYREIG